MALLAFAAAFSTHAWATITGTGHNFNAVEDISFTVTVATFTDTTTTDTVSDFTATVNWGDGSTSTPILSEPSTGVFLVIGTHTYQDEGKNTVTATLHLIRDNTDHVGTPGTATVADATLSLQGESVIATEGAAFTALMAVLTDANPGATVSDYNVTIDWGDGATSPAIIFANPPGFGINGTHTYVEEGNYSAKVTVIDVGGSTASVTTNVNVADAPLAASGKAISATEGARLNNVVMATFTDANPNGTASDFATTINWGDGSASSAGTVVANALGGFDVIGSHLYADEGTYSAQVSINDVGGSPASTTSTVTVADALLTASGTTIVAPHGIPFTGVMATFTDSNANAAVGDFTVVINWGDGSPTSAGTVTSNGNGRFTVTGSHTYAAAGNQTASVTIDDEGGSAATVLTQVIDDFPLTARRRHLHVRLGQPFNLVVASFTDGDSGATVGDFSATINWGDGTPLSVGLVVINGSGFDVIGSHAYHRVDGWNITVRILDKGGASATVTGTARLFPRAFSY